MMGLTPKQKACLDVIEQHIAEHGVPPLYKTICHRLNLKSHSAVHHLVTALVERGAIDYVPHKAQSITVRPKSTALTVEPLPEVRREIDAYAATHQITAKTAAEQALREWFMEPTS